MKREKIEISLDCSDYFEGTINGYIDKELFYERDMQIERYTYKIDKLNHKIKELESILFKAGAQTHKCKELSDWYCLNHIN